jgi:DNA modification methylase
MNYSDFLAQKRLVAPSRGFTVAPEQINPLLFPFQRDIVRWALRRGTAALFANVGLGKTAMQLEWAHHVAGHTARPVLILAPLAVAPQTVREGLKFGIAVQVVMDQGDVDRALAGGPRIFITGYDRAHLFDAARFSGVVLDESSVLKHYSKTFFGLTEQFRDVPFKLCATATPAPNEYGEFGNHSTFLGILHFKDVLARWFVGEGDVTRVARLKHYAREDFWRWLTSWSVCISRPADLGPSYDMPGYDLPPLHIHEHRLGAPSASIERAQSAGRLFPDDNPSATAFMKVKRESLNDRVGCAREIVDGIGADEPIVIWCDTDFEADALLAAFPDAAEVRGSHSREHKERTLEAFGAGQVRMLITKPELAGFGLNWQHCCQMVFAGLSFSFERWYQAVGRVHRYGQARDVHIHLVYTETEGNVAQVLRDKQLAFAEMQTEMNAAMRAHGLFREERGMTFQPTTFDTAEGRDWTYYLGDCVPVTASLPDDSVDLCLHSPPFAQLYVYSDKEADMGNAASKAEFFRHYDYLIRELLRVTVPGRCCAVHVKDLPLFINRDGAMGIEPFSDDVAAAYRRAGWVLQSRITVEKDPVIEMRKTNSHGLLFKNWKEHGEKLRVGLPDYVLLFQKPGNCPRPVQHDPLDRTYYGDNPPAEYRYPKLASRKSGQVNTALPVWQNYANPNWSDVEVPLVWTDIDMMDVLNYLVAKNDRDERHICPLQLGLIARVIHWKTNPGDVVFDPFGGIGSTGVKALEMGRRFIGVELKEDYHRLGVQYLQETEFQQRQPTLFDLLEANNGATQPV